MVATITYSNFKQQRDDFEWHRFDGEPYTYGPAQVISVTATNDELKQILYSVENIPQLTHSCYATKMTWYGSDAQFIVGNLMMGNK